MNKQKKGRLPPGWIPVIKTTMAASAWRAMSTGARILYIELRGHLSNNYRNNGKVYLSDRDAAKAIGVTPGSIVRWYAENEHFGFLRKTSRGFLGIEGRGIADHYRLTEYPTFDNRGTHIAPTRDFDRWDGTPFVYRPKRKKQNPVSKIDTHCIEDRHIRNGTNGSSVCIEDRHIDEAARCVEDRHVSRIATPSARLRLIQGSSTVRAPAQAGGAGSSPAHLAKNSARDEMLMTLVANVVAEQLDALDARQARH
jgi:hypothetical protein